MCASCLIRKVKQNLEKEDIYYYTVCAERCLIEVEHTSAEYEGKHRDASAATKWLGDFELTPI